MKFKDYFTEEQQIYLELLNDIKFVSNKKFEIVKIDNQEASKDQKLLFDNLVNGKIVELDKGEDDLTFLYSWRDKLFRIFFVKRDLEGKINSFSNSIPNKEDIPQEEMHEVMFSVYDGSLKKLKEKSLRLNFPQPTRFDYEKQTKNPHIFIILKHIIQNHSKAKTIKYIFFSGAGDGKKSLSRERLYNFVLKKIGLKPKFVLLYNINHPRLVSNLSFPHTVSHRVLEEDEDVVSDFILEKINKSLVNAEIKTLFQKDLIKNLAKETIDFINKKLDKIEEKKKKENKENLKEELELLQHQRVEIEKKFMHGVEFNLYEALQDLDTKFENRNPIVNYIKRTITKFEKLYYLSLK